MQLLSDNIGLIVSGIVAAGVAAAPGDGQSKRGTANFKP